ncbi:MAG: hypothetical protein AAGN46_05530 [Acidobacteriota bacterium]
MALLDETELSLANLGAGALEAHFQEELGRVLENIEAPGASPKTVRSITVRVDLRPTEDRSAVGVTARVTSRLAPVSPAFVAQGFVSRSGSELSLVTVNPRQQKLPIEPSGADGTPADNVAPWRAREEQHG